MTEQQLLTLFVGIIAICMVFITMVIVLIGINSMKTMLKIQDFMTHVQNELSFLSTKAVLTLHEVNELLINLKQETRSLSEKSKLS